MPYVKEEFREKVDYLLRKLYTFDEVTEEFLLYQNKLKVALDGLEKAEGDFDGTLNYCCTQLIRHSKVKANAESVIFSLLNNYFMFFPKYVKLKDCYGLLFAMKDEFQRRGWEDYGIIKNMQQRLSTVAKNHEKAAQEKNGDLE